MKVAIIEDEFAALENLKGLLEDAEPFFSVCAELDSISEAVDYFSKDQIEAELVFLDIHLSDGSAFEIFRYINIPVPIIFTTAYDAHALEAFEVNSVDYLLKPIDSSKLNRAIQKLDALRNKQSPTTWEHLLEQLAGQKQHFQTHMLIPHRDELIPMAVEELAYVFIENGQLKLKTFDQQSYIVSGKLEEYQEMLDPSVFFRINRQMIAAKKAIKGISLYFNGRLSIKLEPPFSELVLVSKERAGKFKSWYTSAL